MKPVVIEKPGVIVVKEFPTPVPAEGEVLIKVEACALCGTGQRVFKGEKKVDVPIAGHEIVGPVRGVGAGVKGVKPGERYSIETVIGSGRCDWCKIHRENLCENGFTAIGYQYNGGFAEYMVMPKSDPVEAIDLNLIHYPELHLHGANSSVLVDYLQAREDIESGKIKVDSLITHIFTPDDFNRAVETQSNPAAGSMKVVIVP